MLYKVLLILAIILLALLILDRVDVDVTAYAEPAIDVQDGTFGATTTATVTDTRNRFARAWCADATGRVIYEQFVRVVDGQAVFQLGPTALWRTADQAAHCEGETGKLVGGRWTPVAADPFTVGG